jgi:hypothetical protein
MVTISIGPGSVSVTIGIDDGDGGGMVTVTVSMGPGIVSVTIGPGTDVTVVPIRCVMVDITTAGVPARGRREDTPDMSCI